MKIRTLLDLGQGRAKDNRDNDVLGTTGAELAVHADACLRKRFVPLAFVVCQG